MKTKKSDPRTRQQLLEENETLMVQLNELQEMIRAIREGEADAIVVSNTRGEQIIPLTGSDTIYRLIIETIREAAFTVTLDGQILLCNRQFANILGLTPDKIIGKRLNTLVVPVQAEEVDTMLERSKFNPVTRRLIFKGKDAGPIDASISATVLNKSDDVCICIVAVGQNQVEATTEMLLRIRRQQVVIEDTEELMRFALETSKIGAWDLDLVNHKANRSPSHDLIFGYPELLPEWTYEMFLDHVLPEDRALVDEKFQHAQATNTNWDFECRIRRADGQTRWIWASGQCRVGETGSIRRMTGIVQDITERMRADEDLRKSEAIFRSLFDQAAVPKLLVDPGGGVIRFNSACNRFFGFSEDEMRKQTMPVLTHPDDLAHSREIIKRLLADEANSFHIEMEKRFIHKNGQTLWGVVSLSLVRDIHRAPLYFIVQIQDITERKKIEEGKQELLAAVHKERDRLTALLNSIPDEVWFADTAKRFTLVNQSAIREFQLAQDKTIDVESLAGSLDIHRPDGTLRPVDEAPPLRALRGEVVRNEDEIIRTPSTGELRYRQVNSSPVRDSNGVIIGSVSVVRDITDLRQAEEELLKAKEELERRVQERTAELRSALVYNRNLIEAGLDPLVTIGPDGTITDVNTATETVTGYARNELIGTDFLDYFTEPEQARAVYQRVFQEAFVRDYPLEIRHREGRVIPVLYNASVYRDERGEAVGVLAVARDITERRRAEAVINAERQRFYDVMETLPVYIILLTKDYHVFFANRFFRERFGDSGGRRCYEYLFNCTEPCENCESYKAMKTGAPHHWEWTGPDNRNYDIYDYPFTDTDGAQMILEMGIDITDMKIAQAALREVNLMLEQRVTERTADLARSNKELEQFANIASHDLQEPLRSISGFVNLLQQRYQGKLEPRADEYMGFIVEGVTRMQALISDLLSYSRVGTTGRELVPTEVAGPLDRALANLARSIGESNAAITVDALPTVNADPVQLTQLFQNLIGNAIKFSGGRTPEIHVSAERRDENWVFSVRDNGIGINPQYHERIFLIFQRLHTREEYQGTGIGLAICKKIVERHGGSIWVESSEGQGSTFRFTIPVYEGNA